MKINRNDLRSIIIEILLEGEVVDLSQHRKVQDPEQEWYDLLDPESLRRYQQTSRKITARRRQDADWLRKSDDDFESHIQGVESGKVIDIFSDEDTVSEQRAAKAYPGTVGVGIDIPGKDSDSGEAGGKCRALRAQVLNAKAAYQAATQGPDKDAKQVAWEDLEHDHEKECGP